jgi:peroxiredoxin (alkyl hydroperoxide reductase subunit C)
MAVIPPGTPAPRLTLRRLEGDPFTNADLEGATTVLVFYPYAFSSVCTDQFQIYNEVLGDLAEHGATLYGVSCDAPEAQTAFRQSLGVDIEMLSDWEPKGEVCRAFGVYHPAGMPTRALVIVGTDGVVRWSWEGEHPGVLPGANLIFDGLAATAV